MGLLCLWFSSSQFGTKPRPKDGDPIKQIANPLDYAASDMGSLKLAYRGTTDVLRGPKSRSASTPDNNENRGHCVNKTGRHDGFCVSRSALTLETANPYFFKDVRTKCAGGGCPYGTDPPPFSLSPDGRTVSAHYDNWGSAVMITLYADEHEQLTADECGVEQRMSTAKGGSAVFTVLKDCLPLAELDWSYLQSGTTQGSLRFGEAQSAKEEVVRVGDLVDMGSSVRASYQLK